MGFEKVTIKVKNAGCTIVLLFSERHGHIVNYILMLKLKRFVKSCLRIE